MSMIQKLLHFSTKSLYTYYLVVKLRFQMMLDLKLQHPIHISKTSKIQIPSKATIYLINTAQHKQSFVTQIQLHHQRPLLSSSQKPTRYTIFTYLQLRSLLFSQKAQKLPKILQKIRKQAERNKISTGKKIIIVIEPC